ncbi:MAG: CPn0927/CPn0928 family alpha/beta hydrolase fold protein [Parachlamydiaceae bacterium]
MDSASSPRRVIFNQGRPYVEPPSFKATLGGDHAFYNDRYNACELQSNKVQVPVAYTYTTGHKAIRIAKQLFSMLFFPLGIYKLIHSLAGQIAILPACNYLKKDVDALRSRVSFNGEWKYKRITVAVDGYKIDAVIVGKAATLNNGRWVLASNGNGELYETTLVYHSDFKEILSSIKGNGIVFNYPGVGASSGPPSRQAMAKAYRAILTFLEDQKNGIGAKEIIGYGHSIGAGVQSDALEAHELKKDVKYYDRKIRLENFITF